MKEKMYIQLSYYYEKFKKLFYLFICMLPDYMAHDITKHFWKKGILKIWQLVFLWGVKIHFGKLPLKQCIFIYEKKEIFNNIAL